MKLEGTYTLTTVSTHQRELVLYRERTDEEKQTRKPPAEIRLKGGEFDVDEARILLGRRALVTVTILELDEESEG